MFVERLKDIVDACHWNCGVATAMRINCCSESVGEMVETSSIHLVMGPFLSPSIYSLNVSSVVNC